MKRKTSRSALVIVACAIGLLGWALPILPAGAGIIVNVQPGGVVGSYSINLGPFILDGTGDWPVGQNFNDVEVDVMLEVQAAQGMRALFDPNSAGGLKTYFGGEDLIRVDEFMGVNATLTIVDPGNDFVGGLPSPQIFELMSLHLDGSAGARARIVNGGLGSAPETPPSPQSYVSSVMQVFPLNADLNGDQNNDSQTIENIFMLLVRVSGDIDDPEVFIVPSNGNGLTINGEINPQFSFNLSGGPVTIQEVGSIPGVAAVPEPAMIGLLALGLVGLALARRR